MTYRPYTSRTISVDVVSTTTGAGADLLYKVPDRHEAEITFLGVSNADNSNRKVSLQVGDNGSYHYLLKDKSVSSNTFLPVVESSRIYLKAGDELRVYREAGDYNLIASISLKQFYRGVSS